MTESKINLKVLEVFCDCPEAMESINRCVSEIHKIDFHDLWKEDLKYSHTDKGLLNAIADGKLTPYQTILSAWYRMRGKIAKYQATN